MATPANATENLPAEVATRFYAALAADDFETMRALYAPEVKFQDMVFKYKNRKGTMHMWEKLRRLAPVPAKIVYELDRVEGNIAYGHWTADYKVGNRPVHNELTCALTIRDGTILRHVDSSDWKIWTSQAFRFGVLMRVPGVRAITTLLMRGFIRL